MNSTLQVLHVMTSTAVYFFFLVLLTVSAVKLAQAKDAKTPNTNTLYVMYVLNLPVILI